MIQKLEQSLWGDENATITSSQQGKLHVWHVLRVYFVDTQTNRGDVSFLSGKHKLRVSEKRHR